jgi:hypothetical protein
MNITRKQFGLGMIAAGLGAGICPSPVEFVVSKHRTSAPANEAFWPGQSQKLYDQLTCPKTLVPFTVSDGVDLHCEPKGYGLRDLRILNWLDKTLT